MSKKKYSIGFMQGRLVPDERNKIQSFPWKNWKKEFQLANLVLAFLKINDIIVPG